MRLTTAALSATALLGMATMAAPTGNKGQIVAVESASNWCMMLPPKEGGNIAESEDSAIAFCTHNMADAPGAKIFPEGFIQSAHFKKGDQWVQVTGMIDRTKYHLSAQDEGGQYDIKAPPGSWCSNYNHYVNLVEPDINRYCIRCCTNKEDCNTGKSTYGCEGVVPGDYSGPDTPVKPTNSAEPTQTTATTTTTSNNAPPVLPTSSVVPTTSSAIPSAVPSGSVSFSALPSGVTPAPVTPTGSSPSTNGTTTSLSPTSMALDTPTPTPGSAAISLHVTTAQLVAAAAGGIVALLVL